MLQMPGRKKLDELEKIFNNQGVNYGRREVGKERERETRKTDKQVPNVK